MAMKTQGTELFFINPANEAVVKVGCVTGLSGISAGRDQIETTCLEDSARSYEAGLATPGTMTLNINFDDDDASHVLMHQLYVAGTTLHWALGMSGSTSDPVVDSNGTFNPIAARSWLFFDGYIADFPWDLALNAVVGNALSVQISGFPVFVKKTA